MICKPTLLVDEYKCRQNIQLMADKAARHGVEFRPHFKTHQSLEIGKWFKESGVNKITVSSVVMANYFASDWNDITIAFPVNILEINEINELAGKVKLNLQVESIETAEFLSSEIQREAGVFLKIDVGYHRTGIGYNNFKRIDDILKILEGSSNLLFKGFLTHAGHTYKCNSTVDIIKIHNDTIDIMKTLKEKYISLFPDLILSIGDTPGCSLAEDFTGIDEIRPGNFVFYDLMQYYLGSCSAEQIAAAVACPIVAIHKQRNELVIYGGGVHLSKERIEVFGKTIFGQIVERTNSGWGEFIQGMFVKSLSQEHGIVSLPDSLSTKYKVGDVLYIFPVHSCMTANLMDRYDSVNRKQIIESIHS